MNMPLVPENTSGKALDLEDSVKENNTENAINTFNRACTRLLNPPLWHELVGNLSASFELLSSEMGEADRLAEIGDYLKIKIPGPGNNAGDGYDWVKVDAMEENSIPGIAASFAMRLRATANPADKGKGTAHFFKEDATSTFIIRRIDHTITASYHRRNEVPNDEGSVTDKIRNAVVASGDKKLTKHIPFQ